jgi:predicted RNase H-like nuclease (RuvC/YqgF family)
MSCLPGVSFVAAMMFSATNKGVFYNFSIFQVIRSLVQEETSSAATSQAKSEAVEVEGEAAQEVHEHVASKPQETVESRVEEKEEQIKSLKKKIHPMQKENWALRKQKRSLQTAFNKVSFPCQCKNSIETINLNEMRE